MGLDWYGFISFIGYGVLIPKNKLTNDYTFPDNIGYMYIVQNEYYPYIFIYIKDTIFKSSELSCIGPYNIEDDIINIEKMKMMKRIMDKELYKKYNSTLKTVYKEFILEDINEKEVNYYMFTSTNEYSFNFCKENIWEKISNEDANQTLYENHIEVGYDKDEALVACEKYKLNIS